MKLFSSTDIKVVELETDTEPMVEVDEVQAKFLVGREDVRLEQLYKGDFEEGECISYMSNGNWSMYHLGDYIIRKLGTCKIYIATWSISEFSARCLTQWLAEGKVTELNALFDFRSKNRHESAYHLSKQQFSQVRIALCHAKVSIFINEEKGKYISVNGSPNWTENPRIESGVILSCKKTALAHKKWIMEMIEKGEYSL